MYIIRTYDTTVFLKVVSNASYSNNMIAPTRD